MEEQALRFADLVLPDYILPDLEADSRDHALRTMAEFLVKRGRCRPSFPDAILERERHHPSGLPMPGHKIAIPHTDAEHVAESVILFARLRHPVEFRSMGDPETRIPIRLISMFALKEKKRIGDMLETLITAYQDDSTLAALDVAPDAAAMYQVLREAVESSGG